MEATKLQLALDEILKKCKDAGHKLHVFKKEDIEFESVVGKRVISLEPGRGQNSPVLIIAHTVMIVYLHIIIAQYYWTHVSVSVSYVYKSTLTGKCAVKRADY